MKCPNCNKEISNDSKFCNHCGSLVKAENGVLECECCHNTIPSDSKYCPFCGSRITISERSVPDKLIVEDAYSPFNMILVRHGTVMIGTEDEQMDDGLTTEEPRVLSLQNDFYIGENLVTQALWYLVMHQRPSYFGNVGSFVDNWIQLPVENVSWKECQIFIEKLNKLTGKQFRLPTELEWEFAARGGEKSQGYRYSGSDDANEVAWFQDNSEEETHPVGELKPNELGIYDMSGNVAEFCSDWFTKDDGETLGRVIRGGDHLENSDWLHLSSSFNRSFQYPDLTKRTVGFRLALSVD